MNPQRLHTILQKQHARQNQRLLFKQVHELEEYQKKFANKYKHELPATATTTASQLIEGSDFLHEHNDMISELLSTSSMITNKKDIGDMNTVSNDLALLQVPPRNHSESRIEVNIPFIINNQIVYDRAIFLFTEKAQTWL